MNHPATALTRPDHGLSTLLREGTAQAHKEAEQSPFLKAFYAGTMTRAAYGQYLGSLWRVYRQMEASLRALEAHPVAGMINFPALYRQESLEADLRFFLGPDWADKVEDLPGASEYVARLATVAESAPMLLPAHAYTRYLGDLSGGQMIKRTVGRALGLGDTTKGLSFYEFPEVERKGAFKERYRQQLDSLPINEEEAHQMVEEGILAFRLNMKLFADIDV